MRRHRGGVGSVCAAAQDNNVTNTCLLSCRDAKSCSTEVTSRQKPKCLSSNSCAGPGHDQWCSISCSFGPQSRRTAWQYMLWSRQCKRHGRQLQYVLEVSIKQHAHPVGLQRDMNRTSRAAGWHTQPGKSAACMSPYMISMMPLWGHHLTIRVRSCSAAPKMKLSHHILHAAAIGDRRQRETPQPPP